MLYQVTCKVYKNRAHRTIPDVPYTIAANLPLNEAIKVANKYLSVLKRRYKRKEGAIGRNIKFTEECVLKWKSESLGRFEFKSPFTISISVEKMEIIENTYQFNNLLQQWEQL